MMRYLALLSVVMATLPYGAKAAVNKAVVTSTHHDVFDKVTHGQAWATDGKLGTFQ